MDVEEKMKLVESPPTEEIITREELLELLKTNEHPVAYDGFEPSGLLHIASGLMRAIKVQDMLDAGCRFTLLVADWHALLNNKLGGDLENIQKAGKYFVHGWKACGVDPKKVEIKWVSEEIKDPEYWKLVVEVARNTTLNRMMRCLTIMGRKEGELQETAQLLYPAMQVADVFYLDVDICQLGVDQRKANILARELAQKLGRKKPVAVHHHMLIGLQGPSAMGSEGEGKFDENKKMDLEITNKMSKSKPKTCITIHDTPEEIREKIKAAFCSEKQVEGNPVLEICRYIVFKRAKELRIERPEKFGGNITFQNYQELEKTYAQGKLHPSDLKGGTAEALIKVLEPVRKYFETDREARELLEFMKGTKVTR